MLVAISLRHSFLLDSKISGRVRQKKKSTQAINDQDTPLWLPPPPNGAAFPWHFVNLAEWGEKCNAGPADGESEHHAGGHPAEAQGQGTQLLPNNGLRCWCLKWRMHHRNAMLFIYIVMFSMWIGTPEIQKTAASKIFDGFKLETSPQKGLIDTSYNIIWFRAVQLFKDSMKRCQVRISFSNVSIFWPKK